MTEAEWLLSEDPAAILVQLWDSGRGTDRQFALFAVGYERLVRPVDERTHEGLMIIERFAEGLVTAQELAVRSGGLWRRRLHEMLEELLTRRADADTDPAFDERILHAVFRCVFGDPRRPLPHLAAACLQWNDGTIPRIVHGIYEERAFERLPILHDALLDAGCDDQDILAHCRGAGPHVRGCWVIDLILGKQ